MVTEVELFKQGKDDELWQRCCGFIDLSLEDFMMVQRRLLSEQLELMKKCELGRYLMNGANPRDMKEFREQVPLTTYDDYAPYLLNKREDALPKKPILWQYTSGKSGEYPFRWVPVTADQLKEIELLIFAILFFSSCEQRNEIALKKHDRVLYGMAPPPYATGSMTRVFPYELFDVLPPVEEAEKTSFEERMQRGFELALSEGLDVCIALSSVTTAIGNRFSQKSKNTNVRGLLRSPRAICRLVKGLIKSKLAHRSLLPKDLWSLKGLVTFGIDGSIYKDKIKEMWGREPLEFHGCTEAVLIAVQTWDHQGMTFIPSLNFFEFIPEEESIKSREDPTYQPKTFLLDEVKPGNNYELVITSLHGGPFVRYKLGHLIKITSLHNEQLNIDIPQMIFLSRIDDQIDIAGFTRLSEKIIWQAIENTGLDYVDWTARKEVKNKPTLHLYLELKGKGYATAEQIAASVHEELKKLDTPYVELESVIGLRPLEVTLLPQGAFQLYKQRQQAYGANLTQLKPPHINPSDDMIDFLVNPADKVIAEVRSKVKV
ncbi:MAG: GH3 auxin-responsive promoter family protein [Dehalococcoidales bacterium]|nr:GH3 auxin-responsive promoter family protein [Dehalococcoidales bacterium]